MIRYREEVVPAVPEHTRQIVDGMACDICGRDAPRKTGTWSPGPYEVANTTVEIEEGRSYPESVSLAKIEFDICPDCFRAKLVPFLESLGAKGRRTGTEY